jgi:integrase
MLLKLPAALIASFTLFALTPIRTRKAEGAANATVNRELDIIRGVMKRAKRWHRFEDEIKPLKKTENIGRALLYEQKVRLLKLAATRSSWQSAYYAAQLAFNTTCRGCDLKGLQWRDVDLLNRAITIRRSKTDAGLRVIPLNKDAHATVLVLFERAKKIEGSRPEHYVFFSCERGKLDPAKPQKSWRTAWRNLTRSINCPKCGLLQQPSKLCDAENCDEDLSEVKSPIAGLRFHDIRHHAITELAESQTSDGTIMSIAGHVSRKMLEHYSHIRLAAKRTALDGLSGGYDTKDDTNALSRETVPSEVIDSLVELVRIELTTSSLRTMRSPS